MWAPIASAALPFKGVSEAGAEFGSNVPGIPEKDYIFPNPASITHFVTKGMGAIRVPFLWERLQPTLGADFEIAYFHNLTETVSVITNAGAVAILDPHNYARYNGKVIGSGVSVEDFTEFWGRLAGYYKDEANVAFAIMNEPHDMSTSSWASTAQKTIQKIRETGAQQLVLVPGNGWTGAHSWFENWYDSDGSTSNADAFDDFEDPASNFVFEMHQYLDGDASGSSPSCDGASKGVDALSPVTDWLKEKGYKAFIGEFGAGDNSQCQTAVENMLSHMDDNNDVWIGWTWWAAGPWWGDYFQSVEPVGDEDKPQTAWLLKHLGPVPPSPPSPPPSPPSPPPSPSPADCPGGSLDACIDQCPQAAFQACVTSCAKRCPHLALV